MLSRRTAIFSLALSMAASSTAAETILCERTSFSRGGALSNRVITQTFPERTGYQLQGNTVVQGTYGEGTVERSGDRLFMTFNPFTDAENISIRVVIVRNTGQYRASIVVPGREAGSAGARGECTIQDR